eukprot:CAMPEP_0172782410 /NCGR_PEP_ID=MMETSP1074-20121228/203921_1 /TAXON_ID=2916 /ORGANISM="Ceratium fusus, Strain PA161109" /LENGTH=353 /DNA_ID=CAMNT_0013619395 /DNA_START=80 /DNA_END=1141 /DNA_ORIENTATION=+
MSAAAPQQRCGSLAYDLLLEKSCEATLLTSTDTGDAAAAAEDHSHVAVATVDEAASTAAPSSSCSTTGSETPPRGKRIVVVNKSDLVLIPNVVVHGPAVDAELESLLQQARELSDSAFNEDFSAEVTKKTGWKLSLLVSRDQRTFYGFVIAKVTKGMLSVAKIAVALEFRGCGLGRHIMNELRGKRIVVNKSDLVLIPNVVVHGPAVDAELESLLQQARELSDSAFNEDFSAEVTKKTGWKLSLLVSRDQRTFYGFVIAKVTKGMLSVAKIAVALEFRGCGLGRHIMNELMKAAKKQGDVYEVCLSSLPEAIAFYKRLGFRTFEGLRATTQEDVVEGQVYMEKRLRQRPRHRR